MAPPQSAYASRHATTAIAYAEISEALQNLSRQVDDSLARIQGRLDRIDACLQMLGGSVSPSLLHESSGSSKLEGASSNGPGHVLKQAIFSDADASKLQS